MAVLRLEAGHAGGAAPARLGRRTAPPPPRSPHPVPPARVAAPGLHVNSTETRSSPQGLSTLSSTPGRHSWKPSAAGWKAPAQCRWAVFPRAGEQEQIARPGAAPRTRVSSWWTAPPPAPSVCRGIMTEQEMMRAPCSRAQRTARRKLEASSSSQLASSSSASGARVWTTSAQRMPCWLSVPPGCRPCGRSER